MSRGRWQKTNINLKPHHGWRVTPGYNLCVIGRGMMQFEFPRGWVTFPGEESIKLHDRNPPKDDMVLEVSVRMLPPIEWERVSLSYLLQESILTNAHEYLSEEQIGRVTRPDLQLVWGEYKAIEPTAEDPNIKKEAVWRHAVCQSSNLLGILTFGFWSEMLDRADPVWQHVIHSIIMDREIEDPAQGPKFH